MTNTLHYGDNLSVLRDEVGDATVDLIYLDPPFNSNANYNILFTSPEGHDSDAQIVAFEDTWHWNEAAEDAYGEVRKSGNTNAFELLSAMRRFLGENDMMAYLAMMAVRLLELHRVLKPTGSLYLHCDPTASHYLKLLLDAVFGPTNVVNEIIWKRSDAHNDAKQGAQHYGRIHDTLLFYRKGGPGTFNVQYNPLPDSTVSKWYRHVEEGTGRRFNKGDVTGPGGAAKGNAYYEWNGHTRYWRYSRENMERLESEDRLTYTSSGMTYQKRYLDESKGVPLQSVWDDIPMLRGLNSTGERLGYPTQKPLALLERIIAASSDEGDVVLDPFCGCGTAVHAAQKLGRRWIGIDVTHLAVKLIEDRMHDAFPGLDFAVKGRPESLDAALDLARRDKNEFEKWAVTAIDGTPYRTGKGADGGVDGLIYFNGWAERAAERREGDHLRQGRRAGRRRHGQRAGRDDRPPGRRRRHPADGRQSHARDGAPRRVGGHLRPGRARPLAAHPDHHAWPNTGTRAPAPRLPNIDRSTMKKAKREAGRQDWLL